MKRTATNNSQKQTAKQKKRNGMFAENRKRASENPEIGGLPCEPEKSERLIREKIARRQTPETDYFTD